MSGLKELFNFNGRASRIRFWRTYVLLSLLLAVFWVIAIAAVMNLGPIGGVATILLVPVFIANVAIVVRRLHDRGKSGWWIIPFQILPFACSVVGATLLRDGAESSAGVVLTLELVTLVLGLWGLVEIGFLRGKPGANRYGAAA